MPKHIKESLSALVDGEVDELELRRILNSCDKDPMVFESWRRMQSVRAILNDEAVSNVDLSVGIRQALDGVPMDEVPAELQNESADAMIASGVGNIAGDTTAQTDCVASNMDESAEPSAATASNGTNTSNGSNKSGRNDIDESSPAPSAESILGFATLAKISSVAAMVGFVSASLALVVVDKWQAGDMSQAGAIVANASGSSSQVLALRQTASGDFSSARVSSVQLASVQSSAGNTSVANTPAVDPRLDKQLDAYLLQHAEFSSINTGRDLMPSARMDSWRSSTRN